MTGYSTLAVEERGDRVVVTLDRPERRNAIDQQMVDELHRVCATLEVQPRILILTGSGGIFASGADIAELRERTAADAASGINDTIFTRIAMLPMPVIAALDGYALGGGAELAYAADLRIGTPRLRIGNPETGLGIIAAAGALWRLPELVGLPLATELVLTGRILTGEEALAAGLVGDLFEPGELLAGAHALADRIAANDPQATRLTKRVLREPAERHPAAEREAQAVLFESPEKRRRMTEFLERRSRR
ncbi:MULTISPECIES: enoyl-CoA hydratase/isomerase family protein [Microbacteriaceae]|uniref:enoyl-CoA hydratase/isomerase family protein n=1 Tax=Microbacteriaceae TaxID=85023 RepID=UPI0003682F50|nr:MULTISPECIES: enoyl-CoA hydratase/isomerase family protein [Microbacteriaceae]TDP99316.1 enoyl-CoA hydratase/carnithine racemase [Leifsonia sp. 115AMFTsu3.1]